MSLRRSSILLISASPVFYSKGSCPSRRAVSHWGRSKSPLAVLGRFGAHSDQRVARNLCYVSALFPPNRYGPERFGYVSLKARRDIACGVRDLDEVIHVVHVHDCVVLGFFW